MVDGQKDPCQWETPLVVNGYVDVYVFKCLAFLVCRGNSKTNLEDHYGAIGDYTKAIELDHNDASAYYNRGYVRGKLGDVNGACSDWKKAAKLGHKVAAKRTREHCWQTTSINSFGNSAISHHYKSLLF